MRNNKRTIQKLDALMHGCIDAHSKIIFLTSKIDYFEIIMSYDNNLHFTNPSERREYAKLITFPVTDKCGPDLKHFKSADLNFIIQDDKKLAIQNKTQPSKSIKTEIALTYTNLIYNMMRNIDSQGRYRVKFYKRKGSEGVWIKVYINRQYVNDICTRFGVAPQIMEAVMLQSAKACNTSEFVKSCIEDNINAFKNVNQPVTGRYTSWLSITPYCYQHNNVNWLSGIEANVEKGEHYIEFTKNHDLYRFVNPSVGELYYDQNTGIIYNHESLWECNTRYTRLLLKGGCLCDEVGLGKTLSMTSLILSDKFRHLELKAGKAKTAIKKIKPIKAIAKAVKPTPVIVTAKPVKPVIKPVIKPVKVKPEEEKDKVTVSVKPATKPKVSVSVKKRAVKIVPIKKEKVVKKTIKESETETESEIIEIKVESPATLVMCPRRLVGQWVSEIKKYTKRLNVVEMSTMNHVKKYDEEDFAEGTQYDVVVCSFNLLDNKNYRSQTDFNLARIMWRRVIIDEGHEVLLHNPKKRVADYRISSGIFNMQSKFRWVCTGTPLPSTSDSLQAIVSYLAGYGHNQMTDMLANSSDNEIKSMLNQLFHKNTRESIKEYVTIPGVINHTDFLDFTATERTIYDGIDRDDITRKLQVCTNINVSDEDSSIVGGMALNLDEVNKAMAAHHLKRCEMLERQIEKTLLNIEKLETDSEEYDDEATEEIDAIKVEIKGCKDKDIKADLMDQLKESKDERTRKMSSFRNRIKTQKAHLEKFEEDLEKSKLQLQIFRSLTVSSLEEQKCPITGRILATGKVAITPEGYYYSEEGIQLLFTGNKSNIKCPYTRKTLEQKDFYFVDPTAKDNDHVDLERSRWGTKMAHMINKLKAIFEADSTNRVIIFSQWMKMLMLVSHALRDSEINYVFVKGNVHTMTKSIKRFKEDPSVRVILLSSDSCSSGSNLTEANNIILLDAVGGNVEHAKAVEEQAVGRAKRLGQTRTVHVHRFVVRKTIEEEYYNMLDIATETLISAENTEELAKPVVTEL